jgi:hypothetical protein
MGCFTRIPDHDILQGAELQAYKLIKTLLFREAFASIDCLSFHKLPTEYKKNEGSRKL